MKDFKGTKGNWQMIFNHYRHEPKKICIGVGIVEKINDNSEYTEFVCNSLLPDSDKEYLKQREQIEADMKLIAAAPKMLAALINAMNIVDLWTLNDNVAEDHKDEAIVLNSMKLSFEKAINEAIS